jgi:hypothetical protein
MTTRTTGDFARTVKEAFLAAGWKRHRSKEYVNAYSKVFGSDAIISVHVSIHSKNKIPRVDPLVVVENLKLGARLDALSMDQTDCRTAQVLLLMIPGVEELWGGTQFICGGERTEKEAIELLLKSIEEYAIPYLTPYAKTENLVPLLRAAVDRTLDFRVTITDARIKLAAMSEN